MSGALSLEALPDKRLDRLDEWKRRFGPPEHRTLERILASAAKWRFAAPGDLIRFHETLLFLRAYPRTTEAARLADAILMRFRERIAAADGGEAAFEEPDVSGIAGTSLSAVFS